MTLARRFWRELSPDHRLLCSGAPPSCSGTARGAIGPSEPLPSRLFSSGAAGIDRHHCAGDVPAAVAEQKLDGVRHVLDLGQAVQGAAPYDPLALLVAEAAGHVGVDEARGDGIDGDPEAADLASKRAG